MNENYKSLILTFIQYTGIILLMWFMPWFAKSPLLLFVQIFGILIALWALFIMNKSKLNITPTPKKDAILIDYGIYKYIRHPMYLSLLLIFTPVLIENFNFVNITIYFIFTINLILKMLYEESLLKLYFKGYSEYMKKTKRLIPFIF